MIVTGVCEQMLDAYADASAMTKRVADPRKIAQARSKLLELARQSSSSPPDSMESQQASPAASQTSPTTIVYPPSVPHMISHEHVDSPYQAGAKGHLPSGHHGENRPPISSSSYSSSYMHTSSKASSDNLYVNSENVDEVNLDDPYPYSDTDQSPAVSGKRKIDEVEVQVDQSTTKSMKIQHSLVYESPPPPPPDSPWGVAVTWLLYIPVTSMKIVGLLCHITWCTQVRVPGQTDRSVYERWFQYAWVMYIPLTSSFQTNCDVHCCHFFLRVKQIQAK
jgi:hypothetical protein